MKFASALAAELVVSAQYAFASQGPGVMPGQAGLVAQASAQAIVVALAAVVVFGLGKIVLASIRHH